MNKSNLPNFFFLNDKTSYKKIKLLYPSIVPKLIVVGNPIFFLLKKEIKLKKQKRKKIIFFLSEKIPKRFETKKILFIKRILNFLPSDYKLYIKLHPREKNNTYSFIKSKKILIFREYSLRKVLLESEIILGIRSISLIKCALFRNDIISIKIKGVQEKNFIPYKKKWLYPVKNFSNFKNIFYKKIKISNHRPTSLFNKRLVKLITTN